jgi:signal transduction histidine kinase
MGNMKIGAKLQMSNLILIVTVLIVTSVSFHYLSARYLVNQAKREMKADADSIVLSLKEAQILSEKSVAERVAGWRILRLSLGNLQSKMVIFDNAGRMVYTNVGAKEMKTLKALDQNSDSNYLIVKRPIRAATGESKGRILLAAKIKDVSALNRLLQGSQFASMIIGGLAALVLGSLLGRHLSKPIRRLAAGIRGYSPKGRIPAIDVRTRDEIGELANSFEDMAAKLHENDRRQTDFLQSASHELKTPLMVIQGNAEAVKDGVVQGRDAEESLEIVIAECQRLKKIVDELIYLTKLDQVSEVYRFEVMPIGQVVEQALSGLYTLAENNGIELSVTGDMDTEGSFDREKLGRAVINLVGNGIRYAESTVNIHAVRSGGRLEIWCRDDGSGFADGEQNRIFDRFYKGDRGGTGIGLAITKAIVEAHKGFIEVVREEGYGGVIRMTFPL